MSTVSTLPSGRALAAVKGAPETIKYMLAHVPERYDETFKWYTRRGSCVLALGTNTRVNVPFFVVKKSTLVDSHGIPRIIFSFSHLGNLIRSMTSDNDRCVVVR
ncbi:hypothetical protein J3R83DRAFT_5503 [Lanmaoa asiatica]|nr:hypothetical protein J3R83DRAFT_5503 [Lanmaoa asiatica]